MAKQNARSDLSSMLCGWCRYKHVNTVCASELPSSHETKHAFIESMMPIISLFSNEANFIPFAYIQMRINWFFLQQFASFCLQTRRVLTATAVSNVNGPSGFLLHRKPASIFGSIISMADIASNSPNSVWWCTSSPSCNSVNDSIYELKILTRVSTKLYYLWRLLKIRR